MPIEKVCEETWKELFLPPRPCPAFTIASVNMFTLCLQKIKQGGFKNQI